MKLIFPNISYLEGKTICQSFTVDFLKFLRDEKIGINSIDLNNMVAEIDRDIDLDECFNKYLDKVFEESFEVYHYTTKLLGRGKVDIAKKSKNLDKFTKDVFEVSDGKEIKDMKEKLFAGHISELNRIKKEIKKYRCVQKENENGEACKVCGLVGGKEADITERISLVADKCWKPLGSFEQLKGCSRCAKILGLLANLRYLWRINVDGKDRKTRYAVVPKFNVDTTKPEILDEFSEQYEIFSLFRIKSIGRTSTDYIFNSLKSQPIIAKMIKEGKIDLTVYVQSATGQGGYITENIVSSDNIRKIANFTLFMIKNFPKYPYADADAKLGSNSRILSDIVYLYTKDEKLALREFFTQVDIKFDEMIKILREEDIMEGDTMKKEYFFDEEAIKSMNEYGWDNPLVRVSTIFVSERATKKESNRKPEQIINSAMALFNTIPEKEKDKTIRMFLEEITDNGRSYNLSCVKEKPEDQKDFLSQFDWALHKCEISQLKEIARYMRMFANRYMYKNRNEKDIILKNTLTELGYEYEYKIKEG